MAKAPALMQLRDGTILDVRPVEPEDRDLIRRGFERLSPESRYRRFLSPLPELPDRMLTYLTEVDHRDHEALLTLDGATGEVVGVARFVRLESDPASAEVAVTVVDDWQRRGLGTALLDALVDRAREESLTRFTGVALAENRDVLGLLGKLGAARVVGHGPGTVELAVDLPAQRVAPEQIEVRRGRELAKVNHAACYEWGALPLGAQRRRASASRPERASRARSVALPATPRCVK